jgi:hypothetical protein
MEVFQYGLMILAAVIAAFMLVGPLWFPIVDSFLLPTWLAILIREQNGGGRVVLIACYLILRQDISGIMAAMSRDFLFTHKLV